MSFKSTSQSNNGREIKRPTLLPHSFTRWSKEYLIEAVREFGDAGEALRAGKHLPWRKQNYHEHLTESSDTTIESLNELKGVLKEIRMKQCVHQTSGLLRARYEKDVRGYATTPFYRVHEPVN